MKMKYSSYLMLVLIICGTLLAASVFTPASAHERRGNARFFIGFWEGVDLTDGSTIQVSISDVDHDGTLDVRYREGEFSACVSPNDTQGQGLYTGPARVTGHDKITINGALVCVNDDNTQGSPQSQKLTARADREDNILIFAPEVGEPEILHRTSQ